jgi:hypothetical protein
MVNCDAWSDGYPSAHQCDDVVSCALNTLINPVDLDDDRALIERIVEICDEPRWRTSKLADRIRLEVQS